MTPRAADGLHEKYRFPIPPPEPGMVRVSIFGESIKIWPLHCTRNWRCQQCYIEGKLQCDPRFWGEGSEDLHGLVWRQCIRCGKWFQAEASDLKRGRGMVCSTRCAAILKLRFGFLHGRRRAGRLVPCDNCGKLVYKCNFKLRRNKHNFCCDPCKGQHFGRTYGFNSDYRKSKELVAVG